MRELNECRAEVFRRSEKRIRRRRVGRALVACCIPLALCVTVLVASGLADRDPGNADGTVSPHVSVYGGGITGSITEAAKVEQVAARLEEVFATVGDSSFGDGNSDSGSIGDLGINSPPASPGGELEAYTIRIALSDGSWRGYTLTGKILYSHQTQETVELTDTQLSSLKALLGLS